MNIIRVIKKFARVLSRHQKLRIIELAILMVIGGFLEMLSVSIIVPFMKAVLELEAVMANPYVKYICNILGIYTYRKFLIVLVFTVAGIYIFKNIFLLFQMSMQNRFVYYNMFSTQQRLLANCLSRPYEYFLGAKSGEILRVIGDDTTYAFTILVMLLSLFSELVVSGVLIVTSFVIAPAVTFYIAIFMFLIVTLIQTMIRPILGKSGEKNRESYACMQQWLLQAIQGIKEVKIMQKEEFFNDKYSEFGLIHVNSLYKNMTLGSVPRYMIEASSMSSFFVVIGIMILGGCDLEMMVPMLSGVAMAAVRLLPSVYRISQYMASIAFNEPALDKLLVNLREVDKYDKCKDRKQIGIPQRIVPKSRKLSSEIQLLDVSYHYPSGKEDVLSNASLLIRKGESVGIAGSSGVGKTTVIDILLGLLKPQRGQVLVDGLDIQLDISNWLNQIGYIPQSIFLLDGDIRSNIAFGMAAEDIEDDMVWESLKKAALDNFVKELPNGLDTEIGERGIRLSGGQRQRIGIARALYKNPEILFFDEATSALDYETEAAIMESIDQLYGTKTMVIIAHRLTTIENCDHIYHIEGGTFRKER